MNSLDHQNILRTKLAEIAIIFSLAQQEIKLRKLNSFSIQKRCHIFIKLLCVDCLQTFEIVIAILIQRCILAILKIIV